MVGIVRVHRQQTHYIYGMAGTIKELVCGYMVYLVLLHILHAVELKHMWQRIKNTYEKNRPTTDLPTGHTK